VQADFNPIGPFWSLTHKNYNAASPQNLPFRYVTVRLKRRDSRKNDPALNLTALVKTN